MAALVLLSACAHTVAVSVPVLVPARVPVRAFPSIWVSGGLLDDEVYLQDRLAAHLAKDGTREVRRIDLGELEPLRKAGKIPATTVVVLIDLNTQEGSRNDWQTAPGMACGYYGCFSTFASVPVTVAELRGEVRITVYEGPTAKVLQTERLRNEVSGDGYDDPSSDALVDELARQLERAVDVLRIKKRIELYEVEDVPGVAEAVALIRRGDWDEGRRRLEEAAQSLGGQSQKAEARLWFDVGLARWFAPGRDGLTQAAYELAKQALERANQLEPHPVHKRALDDLARARESFALLEEQRRATAANFAAAGR